MGKIIKTTAMFLAITSSAIFSTTMVSAEALTIMDGTDLPRSGAIEGRWQNSDVYIMAAGEGVIYDGKSKRALRVKSARKRAVAQAELNLAKYFYEMVIDAGSNISNEEQIEDGNAVYKGTSQDHINRRISGILRNVITLQDKELEDTVKVVLAVRKRSLEAGVGEVEKQQKSASVQQDVVVEKSWVYPAFR